MVVVRNDVREISDNGCGQKWTMVVVRNDKCTYSVIKQYSEYLSLDL